MISCCSVIAAAVLALWQARSGAPELYAGLRQTAMGMLAVVLAAGMHGGALLSLWKDQDRAARWFAIGGAVVMLWGWALSQFPFIVEPHLTIADAAPTPTLRVLLVSLLAGSLVLFPLLLYLYRIFKGRVLPGG